MELATANERNMAEAFASFGRVPGGMVDASGPMLRVVSGVRVLNSVISTQRHAHMTDRSIEATLDWFAARHASATWYVGPTTTPTDLGLHMCSSPPLSLARRRA